MEKNICRICNIYDDKNDEMVNIFGTREEYLLRQIQSITGLKLQNIDGYPKLICQKCLMDLSCAINFRQRCILSQKQLAGNTSTRDIKEMNTFVHHTVDAKGNMWKSLEETEPSLWDIVELDDDSSDSQIDYFFVKIEEELDNDSASSLLTNPPSNFSKTAINNLSSICKKRKSVGPYVCEQCGREIKNLANFRDHQLRHSGMKSFQCSTCVKRFTTRRELTRHHRCHTGERPYSCRFCSSRFSDLGTRAQHERRHTNDRCYECNQCGKSFVSSGCLSKHMLTHNDKAERNYQYLRYLQSVVSQTVPSAGSHAEPSTHA